MIDVQVPLMMDVQIPLMMDVQVPLMINVQVPVMTDIQVPLMMDVQVPLMMVWLKRLVFQGDPHEVQSNLGAGINCMSASPLPGFLLLFDVLQ